MTDKTNYFEKVIKLLKELNKDNPDVEVSKHISLATSEYSSIFSLSDKELFRALQKHKSELDMNTLSTKELERIIEDDIFNEDEDEFDINEEF